MESYEICISTKNIDLIPDIMFALSNFDCDIHINRLDNVLNYNSEYTMKSIYRLGVREGLSPEEYKRDVYYYKHVSQILMNCGISDKHKGFIYMIECIRVMNCIDRKDFTMHNDIYPIVAEMYNVNPDSIEHNIRNCINTSWNNLTKIDTRDPISMGIFEKKPTNREFMKYISNVIKNMFLDAEIPFF